MPFYIRHAIPSDVEDMVDIYFAAFENDLIHKLCFPPSLESRAFWRNSILTGMSSPTTHYMVVTFAKAPAIFNPTVAYAKWNSPLQEQPIALPIWPIGCDKTLADEFFGQLAGVRVALMGTGNNVEDRPHWYLELQATRPEYQGQGAAGKLIRWGLEEADKDGAETYVESNPVAFPIYQHFMFEEETQVSVLNGRLLELIMVRAVQGEVADNVEIVGHVGEKL
jgi:GNAT superfamily N-acetyltransferase